jgi:DNA polymerase I
MASDKKLLLIDGHSLAYRGFHALPKEMMTARGELTNAVFGFASMLLTVWRQEQPEYMAVAFDVGRTFRHETYSLYKANRRETPEEMASQMTRIRELVDAFQLPVFAVEGYEADDVLGTLARQAEDMDFDTLIVTGDRDAFQLVDDHIRVFTSGRVFSDTVIYDVAAIQEKYGLSPRQLIDLKGLVGDQSDNIPGVRGIGEKTATDLLQKYGTLEGIYDHLDEIKNKRAQKALLEGKETALLSRDLGRIVLDVPIALDIEKCRTRTYDRSRVADLFRELEFRSLVARLPSSAEGATALTQLSMFAEAPSPTAAQPIVQVRAPLGRYRTVTTPADLTDLTSRLSHAGAFALDVETTSTDPMAARLVGISLACQEEQGYYIPVGHETVEAQLSMSEVKAALGPLLKDPRLAKYGHHAKYDLAVLDRCGMEVEGLAFDTMIAEWLLDPASHNLGLKHLAWSRLGLEMTQISELIGTGKAQISMARVPIEQVTPYAGADADVTLRLVRLLDPQLREKALWSLFTGVEMPLVRVLMDIEMAGIALDSPYLGQLASDLQGRLFRLEEDIQQAVGYAFNISSTEQLSDVLFGTLGLPKQGLRKTKSGRYSTAADVLDSFKGAHPVVDMVLEYRQLAKLKSTYIDALPVMVNPETGRLHTSFNQTGAVTGRLSSSEPNLQNIPIRTELGRQIRRAFVAQAGCQLLAADYSQIELRILAHVSGDEAMLSAFARGEDIHASTAATIYGVPLSEVTPDMRRVAKTTNFAISYGVTGYGLSRQTSLTPAEASQFIDQYFRQYQKVRSYLDETKVKAAMNGYVETLLGRRRYFPELQLNNKIAQTARQAIERMAINAPIQGSAADISKVAMIHLHDELHKRSLQSRMVLQVHDELILEVPEPELAEVAPLVRRTMESAAELKAPLKADLKVGKNWLDMEGIE